jgi:peptidoglycan/xylan/chitin deacetylase (PgdA/CDA1 family)
MLTFDDAVESQSENAFPLFEERDMQAVAAVVPNSLNRENRLMIDQIREMRDAGWDISSHPEGEAFTELEDTDAIRQDIEAAHDYLDNRGFPNGVRHMFVPYHNTNEEVVEITREYHELSSYFGGSLNAVPFTDLMHLSRVNMFDLDAFTSMIDIAAEYNQLAIGLAHGVVPEDELDDDPLADMTIEQLERLLDYVEESDVQLVTASELVDNQDSL